MHTDLDSGYRELAVDISTVKTTILEHPEYTSDMNDHFAKWRKKKDNKLRSLEAGLKPKELIVDISETLLTHHRGKRLIDHHDVYQHVMDYWADTMQDDCYSPSTMRLGDEITALQNRGLAPGG